jgi:hypothetical protein
MACLAGGAPRSKSQTFVEAIGGGHKVTGKSGNGAYVDHTLMYTSEGRIFREQIFKYVAKSPGVTWHPNVCAEAHAAAQLLAKGVSWGSIKFGTAGDQFNYKPECPNCMQWIDGGSIYVPENAPRDEHKTKVTLADYLPIPTLSPQAPSTPVSRAAPTNAWGKGPPKF